MGRFAIALPLDSSASADVRRIAGKVEALRAPGGVRGVEVPPHVTLATCTGLDVQGFRPLAAELAARTQPIVCVLASVGVFPGAQGVIFLAPAITRDLVELQLAAVEQLQRIGAVVDSYWTAGQWVPHCTLAVGIPRDMIATAVGQTLVGFQPISGHLVRVGVYAIEPTEFCYEFPLGRP